jgi:glycosyltransferase involved in cell wall biosynthesis
VGRLTEDKGVDILIRALKKIFQGEHRNVFLSIVGDGPMRDRLEQIASEITGGGPIQFVGETREVLRYYQHSHMLVLPSFWEGLPLVLLEGMACGLPVVATDIGGHREVIEDGVNGLLFPVGQVDELASRIVYFIENPDRAKEMGLRGRETVLSGFSLAESLKRYLDLYRSLNL